MSSIVAAADLLAAHRRGNRALTEIPAEIRPADLAEAYAVQDALLKRLLAARGGSIIGYKIACTSPVAQQALQVPHPMFGQLLSASTSPSGATLRAGEFTTRVIECEFAFRMGLDVPPAAAPYDAAAIAPFVGELLPAIEVVDHRYPDWSLGAPSIAADNAIHGHWVSGQPVGGDWRRFDLASHQVTARIGDAVVSTGSGANVLGHPLNALAWLANELPSYGKALRAGDLITTGVCTDVFSAAAGDEVTGDFGELGAVELRWV
ncbi:MAG: 2-keto-4-pentenoate hydratase [Acidimicrobiales bacterium]